MRLHTCGYADKDDLIRLGQKAQNILFDLKVMGDEKHKNLTGVDTVRIHKNLESLCQIPSIKEKIIIRMPMIHGLNDSMEDITAACEYLKTLDLRKINILPYHTLGTSKSRSMGVDVEEYETPSDEHLNEIRNKFKEYGMNPVILGNDETT